MEYSASALWKPILLADLILPGQKIIIHKNISPTAKERAQTYAKNRGLWVVGYREESDIKFLENN